MSVIQKLPNIYSGFSPTTIPGCVLWLDAADINTLTLSGANVLQWNDKSGLGFHASNIGSQYPIFSSVSNVLQFNGTGSQLRTSLPSSNRTETGFLVTYFRGGGARTSIGASAAGYRSIQFDGSSGSIVNRDVLVIATSPSILPGNRKMLFSYDCGSTISVNGTQVSTGSAANFTQGAGVTWIGTDSRGFNYFGDIHEIIVFSNILSSTERQQVEGYLAQKWGLGENYPTDHPFKVRVPVVRQLLPNDIPGCAMWLDAGDQNALVLSGSNVTTWYDKSGYGRHATVSGTAYATLSNSGLYFNNSYYTIPYAANPTNETFFVVFKTPTSFANSFATIVGSQTGGRQIVAGGSVDTFRSITAAVVVNASVSGLVVDTTFLGVSQIASSVVSVSLNGNTLTTGSTASFTAGTTTTLGRENGTNYGYQGFVYELIAFSSSLTTSQRQQVEGYLARKWGILSKLPANHSYRSRVSDIPVSIADPPISANGFTYFVFRVSGTFTLSSTRTVNYLIVGGGGGGGDRHGGGGGAGGVLSGSFTASVGRYIITVGSGGVGGNYEGGSATGGKGGDSSITGVATANGGGGGGTYDGNPTGTFGSGGGGGGQNRPGIAGTAGQGNSGGNGLNPGGGGGGGAGGAGANANTSTGGIGTSLYSAHLLAVGYGTTFATTPNNPISGGVAYIGGGGGGAADNGTAPTARTGGLGGGGTGDWDNAVITTGTPNTGGGGGGCRSNIVSTSGQAGGSGLVLIWY